MKTKSVNIKIGSDGKAMVQVREKILQVAG
jgi:hypothetical protein